MANNSEFFKSREGEYSVTDIANSMGIHRNYLQYFMIYCTKTGAYELPTPIRVFCNKRFYDFEGSKEIISLFKNKKRGEMTEFNKEHRYVKKK